MRKSLITFIIATLLMIPLGAYARNYDVTFNNDNVVAALNILKKETGYEFVYRKELVNGIKKSINGNYRNSSLETILDNVIGDQMGLAYEVIDNTVILRKASSSAKKSSVSGKVTDENGEPVIGASVMLVGSKIGVSTDLNGQFSLRDVPVNGTIQVTYIGYRPASVKVNGRRQINVAMVPDQQTLDEVVVTGYQTLSKERATGSFSVITPEKLEGRHQTDIISRLEGTVAGMKTVNGSTPEIRGISTINGTRTPLYVVDGIPYEGSLAAINPSEIVNVTVLKDATAASIYGARSANGVIVITTRSGEQGKTRVSYNGSVKFTPLPDRGYLNLTNSSELVDLQETLFGYTHTAWDPASDRSSMNEVYTVLYDHENGVISDAERDARLNRYRSLDNYNQFKDRFVRDASIVQQHNISFSGGSGIYRYALSANYQKNYPYEKIQSNDRFGFNLKNTFDFFKWMRVSLGIIQSNTNADYDNGFTGYGYLNSGAPYKMLYNEDGTPTQWYTGKNQDEIDRLNALGLQDETFYPALEQNKAHYNSTSKYQNINLAVRFNLLKGLSLDLMYQNEYTSRYSKQYYSKDHRDIKTTINNATVVDEDGKITNHIPVGGRVAETWGENKSYTMRAQLNFNRQFGELHDIQAIAGTERRKVTSHGSTLNKWGYDDNTLAYKSIDELSLGKMITGTEALFGSYSYSGPYDSFSDSDNRYVSFYANASYTFDRRITASGSIRVDKSNLFGTDPKFQNKPLWSVGLQYLALRGWNWIDRLSVRGTYGINGNVAKQSGPYLIARVSSSPNSFTNDYYANITTPPNPALRWEKTKVLNFGVDFNLLHNRLNGTIDVYSKDTEDLLGQRQTDPTCGWGSLLLNYGSMYNRGFEVSLNSINIANRDFEWTSTLVFSYNKNKLTRIENSGTAASSYIGSPQNREGKPMSALWSVRYAGLNSDGIPTAYKKDGSVITSYVDLEAEDLVYSGTTNPPYTAALTNRLMWKGLSLEFMFVYYGGHKLRDVAAGYIWNRMPTLNYTGVVDRDRLHFWQNPGDENDPDMAPTFLYGSAFTRSEQLWTAADKHIQKGDYIKLRNLIIGYSFPKKLIRKAYLEGLRIDLQIQNLWYWAANKHNLDPEVWSGTSLSPSRGTHIPPTYTIGLSANF